ncbi:MAG: HAD-IIB family hydrolase [Bdellovibrionales bacterium]|nr:HAD-IIB family hydrolase [Bdellovibrionales bacterium]
MKTAVLASDLDGTLIPLERTAETRSALRSFGLHCGKSACSLIYVTGRHLSLALDGVVAFELPQPETIIADVGTTIWRKASDQRWELDQGYAELLRQHWNGREATDIGAILDSLPELRLQPDDRQGRFKRSYFVDLDVMQDALAEDVRAALENANTEAQLICSVDPVKQVALLDVLPPQASKLSALEHLCNTKSIARETLVYAGDSGNDLQVFESGIRSVLVANTPADVIARSRTTASTHGRSACIYIATQKYTAGVIEGCQHFGLFEAD